MASETELITKVTTYIQSIIASASNSTVNQQFLNISEILLNISYMYKNTNHIKLKRFDHTLNSKMKNISIPNTPENFTSFVQFLHQLKTLITNKQITPLVQILLNRSIQKLKQTFKQINLSLIKEEGLLHSISILDDLQILSFLTPSFHSVFKARVITIFDSIFVPSQYNNEGSLIDQVTSSLSHVMLSLFDILFQSIGDHVLEDITTIILYEYTCNHLNLMVNLPKEKNKALRINTYLKPLLNSDIKLKAFLLVDQLHFDHQSPLSSLVRILEFLPSYTTEIMAHFFSLIDGQADMFRILFVFFEVDFFKQCFPGLEVTPTPNGPVPTRTSLHSGDSSIVKENNESLQEEGDSTLGSFLLTVNERVAPREVDIFDSNNSSLNVSAKGEDIYVVVGTHEEEKNYSELVLGLFAAELGGLTSVIMLCEDYLRKDLVNGTEDCGSIIRFKVVLEEMLRGMMPEHLWGMMGEFKERIISLEMWELEEEAEEKYKLTDVIIKRIFGGKIIEDINFNILKRIGIVEVESFKDERVVVQPIEYIIMKGIELNIEESEFIKCGIDQTIIDEAIEHLLGSVLIRLG